MFRVDEPDKAIPLSLEGTVTVEDYSGLPGWNGYSVPTEVYNKMPPGSIPTVEQPASLSIESDFESTRDPQSVIWFMFFVDEEPWFRLTVEEAEKVYHRLGRVLGKNLSQDVLDQLTEANKQTTTPVTRRKRQTPQD